jgi:hypothetical protein
LYCWQTILTLPAVKALAVVFDFECISGHVFGIKLC